jgi:hypothetical protein
MKFRSIVFSALFAITLALPTIAHSEMAALIDFNNADKRSEGTVMWRTEQVKTSDGRDDLAIRADVDIPGPDLKLKMVLRRNLDPSTPASHVIELGFTIPPALMDGSLSNILPVLMAPAEMSGQVKPLSGAIHKTNVDGLFMQAFSIKPAEICENLAVLNGGAWLAVYVNGAKRKPNVFGPAIADQGLWISKGESGQQVFDAVFAAWEKAPGPAERNTVCQPS